MQSVRTTASNLSFSVCIWRILPNFKLCGSHFELLAAILNCFDCCFCVIISNLNIYDCKHVQINKPVKITTLNSNFRLFLSKNISIFGPFGGHFEIFGGHSWIFIGSSGIKTSNWNTCLLITCQRHAISKNYSLKFDFQGVYWWILPYFKLCGSHFEFFWRPFWIFIGSSCIKFSNFSISFNTICQNHAINKNYSLKFEIRGAHTPKYCYLRVFYGIPAVILDFRKCSRVRVSHPGGSYSVPFVE